MERDYLYEGLYVFEGEEEENEKYHYKSNDLCKACFLKTCSYSEDLTPGQIGRIPNLLPEEGMNVCIACGGEAFYSGYLHFRYRKTYPFLERQLAYQEKYPLIETYWPETSLEAQQINEMFVPLLQELFEMTMLYTWTWRYYPSTLKKFVVDSPCLGQLKVQTLVKAVSGSCFRFSDYYQVLEDVQQFTQDEIEKEKIQKKIGEILAILGEKFLSLYAKNQAIHPTPEIEQEIALINYLKNSFWQLTTNSEYEEKFQEEDFSSQPGWFLAQFYLIKGELLNEAFLYSEAIELLTKSIQLNPKNPQAYLTRAYTYFELNQIDQAIEDYEESLKWKCSNGLFLQSLGWYDQSAHLDQALQGDEKTTKGKFYSRSFSQVPGWSDPGGYSVIGGGGIVYEFGVGVAEGVKEGLSEFVPNTLGSLSGMAHGLWAFSREPQKTGKDFVESVHNFVNLLRSQSYLENISLLVPELEELVLNWDRLLESQRMRKIGFIIGKYGLDVLIPYASLKTLKHFREIKKANTMLTLQQCVESQTKRATILENSAKFASSRQAVFAAVKRGKIVAQNSNVILHVMQNKHAWNRLIKVTGNKSKDFQKVVRLLEKNKILTRGTRERLRTYFYGDKEVGIYRYSIEIDEQLVDARFVEYVNGEEKFLSNAWVKTSE
ncbi:MAG: tetratricopeptide repeat protein [Waddliaceae bacterium]